MFNYMISLVDYIFGKRNNFSEKWKPTVDYSFEEFCNDCNVSDENYDEALEFYNNHHWYNTFASEELGYNYHANIFYESIMDSYNGYRLIDKLKDEFSEIIKCEKYKKGNQESDIRFKIYIETIDNNILIDKKLLSLLNTFNYIVCGNSKLNNDKFSIIVRPNKADEKTKEVHNEDFIYHLTYNNKVDKILKYGIHPKDNNEDISKVYIFLKKENDEDFKFRIKGFIKEISMTLLKIDVSKLPKEMKFFLDDGAQGYDARYTFEPIPPNAIIDKEIIYKRNP